MTILETYRDTYRVFYRDGTTLLVQAESAEDAMSMFTVYGEKPTGAALESLRPNMIIDQSRRRRKGGVKCGMRFRNTKHGT